MQFDTTLFEAIHGIVGTVSALDIAGTFFARSLPLLMAAAFLVFLIIEADWKVRFRKFAFAAIAIILSRWIIGETVQFFYPRVRPSVALNFESLIPTPSSPSFPSGHAAILFALAAAVFLVNRRWGTWFFVGAFFVGIARVFVGVHWPSDIAAGAVAGIASAFVAWKFLFKPRTDAAA